MSKLLAMNRFQGDKSKLYDYFETIVKNAVKNQKTPQKIDTILHFYQYEKS